MNLLELKNIGKQFDISAGWAVKNFSLEVEKGEIVALLGESGCGKTTLLRIIAGFEKPTTGELTIREKIVCNDNIFVQAQKRNVGIVFQDYALFPHKTVHENILYGLYNWNANKATSKLNEVVKLCGLEGLEKRYPHQLSGGQKQRVALARALAPEPELILFDEPFSNLDSMRKNQMRNQIQQIIKRTESTAIFVTHDTKDVLSIADKVSVIKNGECIQTGSPSEIYNSPVSSYVADFFGKSNFLKVKVSPKGYETPFGFIEKPSGMDNPEEDELLISIRPEAFTLQPNENECYCGTVLEEKFLGEYKEVTCKLKTEDENEQKIILYTSPTQQFTQGKCFFNPIKDKINIVKKS